MPRCELNRKSLFLLGTVCRKGLCDLADSLGPNQTRYYKEQTDWAPKAPRGMSKFNPTPNQLSCNPGLSCTVDLKSTPKQLRVNFWLHEVGLKLILCHPCESARGCSGVDLELSCFKLQLIAPRKGLGSNSGFRSPTLLETQNKSS